MTIYYYYIKVFESVIFMYDVYKELSACVSPHLNNTLSIIWNQTHFPVTIDISISQFFFAVFQMISPLLIWLNSRKCKIT